MMRNNAHGATRMLLVLAAFLMAGCSSLGKDNILFVTKTSVGVDVDSKPPTLVVGFDRKELTISPRFEGGEVLPQMAGFKGNLGIINQAIGQSFATGTAAILMAKYLASPVGPDLLPKIPINEIEEVAFVPSGDREKRKRYFFGTDTSFAFKVGFGLETGGLPDSVSLGYKRKELAFVPLAETTEDKVLEGGLKTKKVTVLPSLLATADLATETSGPKEGKAVHLQFFATGEAASFLAALPQIRQSVVPKLLPDAKEALDLSLEEARANSLQQRSSALSVILCYERLGQEDKFRAWTHLISLGLADDDKDEFKAFEKNAKDANLPDTDRAENFKKGEQLYRATVADTSPLDLEKTAAVQRHRDLVCVLTG